MTDFAEIKSLVEQTGDAFASFKTAQERRFSKLADDLASERKEREELELRMQRAGSFAGGGDSAAGKAELKALGTFIRTGDDSELKSMLVGSDPDGGYMVLPVMGQSMVKKIFDQSALARVARRITIGAGDRYEEIIDNNESGASWVGETESRPATTTPQIGKISIPVHEIYALQSVTQRLLDDAVFDVGAWVEGKIADKFGRAEGAAFISGDDIGKPGGLLAGPAPVTTGDATRAWGTLQYVATGNASDFGSTVATTTDKLIELVYSVRAPYKSGPNVGWLMNSTTAGKVRRFKIGATTDQYTWQPGIASGEPPLLLGYPVWLDENMPDCGADQFPIAFGNFDLAYYIVDKAGIRMLRDPYSSKPNVLFYAYRRVGGGLANTEAVKLIKCANS